MSGGSGSSDGSKHQLAEVNIQPGLAPRHFDFVTLVCADGLELDAFWVTPTAPRAVVIHIHGKGGNFYHNAFLRAMYRLYPTKGLAVLGVNTRGNAAITEASQSGRIAYVGAARERLTDCLLDIEAAIDFASRHTRNIILQGHSYGCDKVLYFVRDRTALPAILISPGNSALLQEIYCPYIDISKMVQAESDKKYGNIIRLAPSGNYGIRTERQQYDIPIESHILAEMLNGDDLSLFDFRRPAPNPVDGAALIMLGEADDLQVGSVNDMAIYCGNLFSDTTVKISPNADHHFSGFEQKLCNDIVSWINADSSI